MFRDCSRSTYWTRKMHPIHLCPTCLIVVPCTWQMTEDLYVGVASLTPSFEPLQMDYKHLQLTWRPMKSLVCPPIHWEHHKFIMWITRGQPLVRYFLKSNSSFLALIFFTRPLREPKEMHYWLFKLLEGLLFFSWATLVRFLAVDSYLHIILVDGLM